MFRIRLEFISAKDISCQNRYRQQNHEAVEEETDCRRAVKNVPVCVERKGLVNEPERIE